MGHTCTRHAHACTQRACTHSHRLGAPLHSLHLSLHLSLYTTAPPHRPFVPAALGPLSRLLARRPRQAGWPGATPTRTLLLTYSRLSGDGRVVGRSMVRGRARCVPRCSNACLSRTPAASSPLPRRSAPCDQHHHTSEGPHHCSASPPHYHPTHPRARHTKRTRPNGPSRFASARSASATSTASRGCTPTSTPCLATCAPPGSSVCPRRRCAVSTDSRVRIVPIVECARQPERGGTHAWKRRASLRLCPDR